MAQQSARRGWDNQGFPQCFEHALGDLDPVRELPYRPAAVFLAASKAGQMTASDHAQQRPQRFPLPERGRPQMESGYSMTSSARARIDCGTMRPSALAVFRLMTNSNVVGCWTGRSAGLVPFR